MQHFEDIGKHIWFKLSSFLFMFFMFTNSYAKVNAFDKAVDHPPIPILDEQGNHVLETNQPYSPKKSCEGSGCHDYEAITHAYHFEMGRDEASDNYGAKRGLPHLVSPGYYGGYSCMGGDNPQILAKKNNPGGLNEFADYGSAGHIKTCMTCHQGGGWAEKDRNGIRYDQKNPADIKFGDGDYYERHTMNGEEHLMLHDWKKSGVAEADCMYCHLDFSTMRLPVDSGLEKHKGARKARTAFSGKGFFREAATGLMELVVDNKGQNLVTVERAMQPNPGMHGKPGKGESIQPVLDANGKPKFKWNPAAFNAEGRTIIPMLRFPDNENCMECHRTSNGRRGFYGFGEAASATLKGEDAAGILEDDYKDDVHKGKIYVENNGQARTIDNCNACHSKQYYKSPLASMDLDANHDFPKGNSDMDVRNDLDYSPNAKSCEECHIKSNKPIIPSGHKTLLEAHVELWKGNGDMAGYSKESLTKITKTHFDVVSCQACHITGKKDHKGKPIPVMYRYRIAEDGLSKIVPYKPYARALWKDKVSGRVLGKLEKKSIYKEVKDETGKVISADIVDPESGKILGQTSAKMGRHGLSIDPPESYEQFMSVKGAYDGMLRKKGVANPNVALFQSESNEYIISHNTRPSPDSVQCEECHERKQSGAFSALVSPNGIFGEKEMPVKGRSNIPDPRLVTEGHIVLDMKYTKMKPNGDLVQSVSDILFETKIDPFMSLLKNSSASETIGEFKKNSRENMLAYLGPELAQLMSPELGSAENFLFQVEKGRFTLRKMGALIDGNTINSLLFPSYRGVLGLLEGSSIADANNLLQTRGFGTLRSDVFYFEVRDGAKKHVESFNGASMFVLATYKGNKTDLNGINVVVADWGLTSIRALPSVDLVTIKPAIDGDDGYVIFKMTAPGYFVVTDK